MSPQPVVIDDSEGLPEDIKEGKALKDGQLAKDLTPIKDSDGKAVKGFRGGTREKPIICLAVPACVLIADYR